MVKFIVRSPSGFVGHYLSWCRENVGPAYQDATMAGYSGEGWNVFPSRWQRTGAASYEHEIIIAIDDEQLALMAMLKWGGKNG